MHAEKAQIGIEVMAIVAVMMLLLLPLTYVLLVRGGQFNEQAAIAKADENAARIAATADQVGSMGPGSKVVLQVDMPVGITAAEAKGNVDPLEAPWGEISFTLKTSYGDGDVVGMSKFSLVPGPAFDSLKNPGTHYIVIATCDGTVCPAGKVQIGASLT